VEDLIILSVKRLRIFQIVFKKSVDIFETIVYNHKRGGHRKHRGGEKMNELKKAMQELGFRVGTVVTVRAASIGRLLVSVNGEDFGVWDSGKNTFVD
jgi:hypothetical protein